MSTEEYDKLCEEPVDEPAVTKNEGARPLKCQIGDVTEIENHFGEVVKIAPTAARVKRRVDTDKHNDFAMLIRRRLTEQKEPKSLQLELRSPILKEAIKHACRDGFWVNTKVKKHDPIIIKSPYIALFYAREKIKDFTKREDLTAENKEHLNLLVKFIQNQFHEIEKECDRLISANKITHLLYWTLFQPYEEVVHFHDRYTECFLLSELNSNQSNPQSWKLSGTSWDYISGEFGPVSSYGALPYFEGAVEITKLSLYPLRYHKTRGSKSLKDMLVDRGRKWKASLNAAHYDYEGDTWEVPKDEKYPNAASLRLAYIKGRVIGDYTTFVEEWPNLRNYFYNTHSLVTNWQNTGNDEAGDGDEDSESESVEGESEPHELTAKMTKILTIRKDDKDYEISEEQALLCPARVPGFALNDKKWAYFLVDRMQPISWRSDALEKLEIAEESKKVIKALVKYHELKDPSNPFDDIITGKGNGLVFLFAGDPGLGKTLTAECIAEWNQKPLYAITSGELGTNTLETDTKLRKLFRLAKAWGAYLLLDEADVFLAKRDHAELARNGLVTIFLRQIEYYGGVIFLTTNQLTQFDPAFESRIHFKLFYEPLTSKQRAMIWKHLLPPRKSGQASQLRQPEQDGWSEDCLLRLGSQYNVNGREIRNMIKNALALAYMQDEELDEKHLLIMSEINHAWNTKVRAA